MLTTVKLACLFCEHGLTKKGQKHTIKKEAVRVPEAVELTICPSKKNVTRPEEGLSKERRNYQ